MDTYAKLRQALEQIPLIDDHSHVLHHNIESPLWEGPYPVLPLTRVLLDFNTRSCFTNPGLTESQVADCLMGRISPEEQKQLLTAPHCKKPSCLPLSHGRSAEAVRPRNLGGQCR